MHELRSLGFNVIYSPIFARVDSLTPVESPVTITMKDMSKIYMSICWLKYNVAWYKNSFDFLTKNSCNNMAGS